MKLLGREMIRDVAGVTGARVISAFANLITVAVFIRLLGPAAFGTFVLFRGVTRVLMVVSDFGINMSVEKRLSESLNGSILSTGVVLKLPLLILTSSAVLLFSTRLENYLGAPVSGLLIAGVALATLNRATRQALKGAQRVTAATSIKAGERVFVLVVGALSVQFGGGVEQVIVVLVSSFFGGFLVCWWLLPVSFGRPSADIARSLLEFSKFGVFPSVIGPLVFSWTDTLIVGVFLPREFVSAYEAAWKLSKTTTLLSGAIATTGFPRISNWDERDKTGRISEFIPPALVGSLLVVVPATAGVLFVGEDLLSVLFSPSTTIATTALIVLVAARIPLSVTNVLGRVNLGMNRPNLVAKGSVMMMTVNVVGNVGLVSVYGLIGAAVATATSAVLNAVYQWYVARKLVSFRVPTRYLTVLVIASGTMTGVLALVDGYAPMNKPLSTALLVAVGAVVYFTVILSVPEIRTMVRSSIRR